MAEKVKVISYPEVPEQVVELVVEEVDSPEFRRRVGVLTKTDLIIEYNWYG